MIEIIPAIDIIGGQCVRLEQGDYGRQKSYSADVLEVARGYEAAGVRRLHMVDLDGARESFPRNLATLEKVAAGTTLEIQYGGGIKSAEALRAVFEAGARRAICGSVAVSDPELFRAWLGEFGPDRMILGADIRDGKVATHGWLESSTLTVEELIDMFAGRNRRSQQEQRPLADYALQGGGTDAKPSAVELAWTAEARRRKPEATRSQPGGGLACTASRTDRRCGELGVGGGLSRVICTDISKDGMLQGPSFDLYDRLQRRYPAIEITVSGGIGSFADIVRLDKMNLRSVIVGKAIYEGEITLTEIKMHLENQEKCWLNG